MRILLALLFLCRWGDLLAQELTTGTTVITQRSNTVKENLNIADKRLKFVNIIRDDLRRNNDDYALLEQQNQLAYLAPPAHPPQPQPSAPRLPYHKRVLPPGPRPQPPRLYYGDTRRGKGDMNQPIQDDNAFRSYTHSKHYKIERANKLKRLLKKDKLRTRDAEQVEDEEDTTINTLPETKPTSPPPSPTPRPPAPPTTPPPATTRSKPPPTLEPSTHFSPQRRDTLPPKDMEQEVPILRQRKDRSPSPDQLDMAAARNPQITRIRLKGRLCQRSLMNLEGPTYDKLGKEVIPEYKPRNVRARQFHQTRAPKLVLPRCCNCCKKSVLGCQ